MLSSVGVIIAAAVIYAWPQYSVIDPICTYIFSVIICFTTTPIFKDCIRIMMEGSPKEIDIEELIKDISEINCVEDIHDFHLWSISSGKFALSCHIMSDQPLKALSAVTDLVRREYNIFHTTVQTEGFNNNPHAFKCDNDIHD